MRLHVTHAHTHACMYAHAHTHTEILFFKSYFLIAKQIDRSLTEPGEFAYCLFDVGRKLLRSEILIFKKKIKNLQNQQILLSASVSSFVLLWLWSPSDCVMATIV